MGGSLRNHFGAMDRMFSDMHSSSFSSHSGSMRDGVSKSISTSTTYENGKKVTRTSTSIRHADGRVETTSNEEHSDAPDSRYLGYGGSERDAHNGRRYIDVGGANGRSMDKMSSTSTGARLLRK